MSRPNATHLGFVQDAIARLSRHSFTIKGWSVTVVVALLGFGTKEANGDFAWLALFAALVFAVLDAYYLALERAFIALYDDLTGDDPKRSEWDMRPEGVGVAAVTKTLGRPAVFVPHGSTVVVSLVVLASL